MEKREMTTDDTGRIETVAKYDHYYGTRSVRAGHASHIAVRDDDGRVRSACGRLPARHDHGVRMRFAHEITCCYCRSRIR